MRSTIFIGGAAALLLAGCAAEAPDGGIPRTLPGPADGGETGAAGAEIRAFAVEEQLRGQVGQDAGGARVTGVTRDGSDVAMTIRVDAPVDASAGARVGDAIAGTFARGLCDDAGLLDFFAGGGTLAVSVRNAGGAEIARRTISSCS
ncbi:hypothetical protein BCF33_0315 [Hasllibacter halocynthiae]|uniref:Uncharacterized protein n=1 Tax=Hasllibacter halocynthiae TaxID=595589 RepID=A0A2T0X709_9RHOB|nr:hypothetical protein [Hasllibacter halocynthiae]PRY94719.1 hypothetical protein BCF33_0315 [Hasllibacter halocynthiae]